MAQRPSTDPHAVNLISSPPRPRRRTSALALVAAGVVGGTAIGLSSGAFASGGSSQPTAAVAASTPPAHGAHGAPDRRGGGRGGGHNWFGQSGRALHGTATIPKAGGGYEQLVLQRGAVTAVSPTSLVVTSTDGFVATYVLTAATKVKAATDDIAALKVTDKVAVVATVTGGVQQATRVIDLTTFAGHRDHDGRQGQDGYAGHEGEGAPRPGATATPAPPAA